MALNSKAIGQRVKTIRRRRGYTQLVLSEKINITTSYLSKVEMGARVMSVETLIDIANVLNVSTDELLIDNLDNKAIATNHLFAELLADCSDYEWRVLSQILAAAKEAIRANRTYFRTIK